MQKRASTAPKVIWWQRIPVFRVLLILLGVFAAILFLRLWFGSGSYPDIWDLRAKIATQQAENAQLETRNAQMAADIAQLGLDDAAIEEHTRNELGMIKEGETFYQIVLQEDIKAQPPDPSLIPSPTEPTTDTTGVSDANQ